MPKPPKRPSLVDLNTLQVGVDHLSKVYMGKEDCVEFRNVLLKLLKDACAQSQKKAEAILLEEADGLRCAQGLSDFADAIITIIYHAVCPHQHSTADTEITPAMALVAVGGYGRGALAPYSDIDLLFLLPENHSKDQEEKIEFVLYLLWDLGFKVGHATRNLDECIAKAREDVTIRTALLESRLLLGDAKLYQTFLDRFDREVVANTARQFIEAKLNERNERHKKSGQSRYRVEPNIKDGKGGLRDLHTLYWIGKYHYRVNKKAELVKAGFYTRREFNQFVKAETFLWTVRCHLHFIAGRPEEKLSFEYQQEIARRLRYVAHDGLLQVERFMKHYFLIAKQVGDLTLIACAQLEEANAKQVSGFNGLIASLVPTRKKPLKENPDFINERGRINVTQDNVFKKDPHNLLVMFVLAAKHNLNFHPDTARLARRSLSLIDKELRRSARANALFLEILTDKDKAEPLLRKMNEFGVLGKFLPAFRKIVAMMQFNMYHHYTVDEHLIRTVGILAAIERGDMINTLPLASRLFPRIDDRIVLYVAAFIHDIAKGRKEDHSIVGEKVARKICPRLGLSKGQTELVSWLVREHLLMSNTAQSRDIGDWKTVERFANIVQTKTRMRYLLILTACDIMAVGPGVWNGWKGQLLRTLYGEAEYQITGGYSRVDRSVRVEQAKQELSDRLHKGSSRDWTPILALPYDSYFLANDPDDQPRHMQIIASANESGKSFYADIHSQRFEQTTEIILVTGDHPRLLGLIASACAKMDAEIVGAHIHTLHDGRAFDIFSISRKFDDDDDEIRRTQSVMNAIEASLSGKGRPSTTDSLTKIRRRRHKLFKVDTKISIANDLSNRYTVIEIEALDRSGLLSLITNAISELNLNIGSAHVTTFGEKAIDVFYVTDLTGAKIEDPSRQRKIREFLARKLKLEDNENTKKTRTVGQSDKKTRSKSKPHSVSIP